MIDPQATRHGKGKAAPQGRAVVEQAPALQRCAGTNVTSNSPTRTDSHQSSPVRQCDTAQAAGRV